MNICVLYVYEAGSQYLPLGSKEWVIELIWYHCPSSLVHVSPGNIFTHNTCTYTHPTDENTWWTPCHVPSLTKARFILDINSAYTKWMPRNPLVWNVGCACSTCSQRRTNIGGGGERPQCRSLLSQHHDSECQKNEFQAEVYQARHSYILSPSLSTLTHRWDNLCFRPYIAPC